MRRDVAGQYLEKSVLLVCWKMRYKSYELFKYYIQLNLK